MTFDVRAGQIWRVNASAELALVVFVWNDELFGEDVRLLPVFAGPEHAANATERDVVVHSQDNTLREELLVNCWNGQTVSRDQLWSRVGEVSDNVLRAAHAVEMLGLAPDVAQDFSGWTGATLENEDDPRMAWRRYYFAVWDDLRTRQTLFRDAYEILIEAPSSMTGLFVGEDGRTGEFSTFTLPVTSTRLPMQGDLGVFAEAGESSDEDDTTLRAA